MVVIIMIDITNRRYIGSKRRLITPIKKIINNECKNVKTIADIFGGIGNIANAFNPTHKIIINDILYSNYITYDCFFSNSDYDMDYVKEMIDYYNALEGNTNYFSQYGDDKYFTKYNADKIGVIREEINKENGRTKNILLTSLLYATDKIANTAGVYEAYLKKVQTNAQNNILLEYPNINDEINVGNEIYNMDSNKLVRQINPDLIYIDPPYNPRQYGSNYHILENLVEWNKPELFGKTIKHKNNVKSDYSSKRKAKKVFDDLIQNINSKYVLVSYSNAKTNILKYEDIIEIMGDNFKVFNVDINNYKSNKNIKKDIIKEFLFFKE